MFSAVIAAGVTKLWYFSTSKCGQFICMPGPWMLKNHFRSSCGLADVTVSSSSLYTVAKLSENNKLLVLDITPSVENLVMLSVPETFDFLLDWGGVSCPTAPLWWNAASSLQTAGTAQTPAPCSQCRVECTCWARQGPSHTFLWPKL